MEAGISQTKKGMEERFQHERPFPWESMLNNDILLVKHRIKSYCFLNRPEFLVQLLSFCDCQKNHQITQMDQGGTKANESLRKS